MLLVWDMAKYFVQKKKNWKQNSKFTSEMKMKRISQWLNNLKKKKKLTNCCNLWLQIRGGMFLLEEYMSWTVQKPRQKLLHVVVLIRIFGMREILNHPSFLATFLENWTSIDRQILNWYFLHEVWKSFEAWTVWNF